MSKKNRGQSHPSTAAASDELHEPDVAGDGFTPAAGFTPGPELEDDERDHDGPDGTDLEPVGAPANGATPVAPVGAAPSSDDRVANLEAQLAELRALLSTSAAAATIAPPGYKLVKDEPTQDAKSLAEQAAIKAEIDKGNVKRTQEHCNKLFPEGKHVFRCQLAADRNGNPELMVRASNPTDAVARYLAACGINHTEHRVECVRA